MLLPYLSVWIETVVFANNNKTVRETAASLLPIVQEEEESHNFVPILSWSLKIQEIYALFSKNLSNAVPPKNWILVN